MNYFELLYVLIQFYTLVMMLGVERKGFALKTSLSFVHHHTQQGSQVLSDHGRLTGTLLSAESEQALESGHKEDRYFI